MNFSSLKKYSDFRWLYIGQFVSLMGTMISYVAVPYQIFKITGSSALVGLLGVVQLVPLVVFGLIGGTYADRLNRKKLIVNCEIILMLISLLLLWNASLPHPYLWVIFALVAVSQAVVGFHRPAMEAMIQKMIPFEDFASVGAMMSFQHSFCAIAGPSMAGIMIALWGAPSGYALDAFTYLIAVACLMKMSFATPPQSSIKSPLEDLKAGLAFARSKPELMGTYIVDIVAMLFAFPVALFPAMASSWGGAKAAGSLFSAMAVGALIATFFSTRIKSRLSRGKGVVMSAFAWAVFIIVLGHSVQFFKNTSWGLILALGCLVMAGLADTFSAIFRKIIWNETIPNEMRGRLSGIEMISYLVGPFLGNARAGYLASKTSVTFSLISGGYICLVAVVITALLLPKFWLYRSQK